MLYHLLVCSFIPISGWPCYIIFWFANLYLCLVCKFIPISVIKYYTYFCYGYFCFFQIWYQTYYIYFWFAILYLRLLYPILVYSILLVMASSVISSSAPPGKCNLKILVFLGTLEFFGMFGWCDNFKKAKKYWYLPQILPIFIFSFDLSPPSVFRERKILKILIIFCKNLGSGTSEGKSVGLGP